MLFGVWLLYCAFGLVVTSLAPLVRPIVESLALSHAQMGSVLGAWQLVYIVSSVPCGLLLDRLGARVALLLAALVIAVSAAGRAWAGGYLELLLAVMLFGLAGPIVSAGAPKVIAQWFGERERGLAMGIYMTGPSIGGVVSLMLTHSVLMPAFDDDWRGVLLLWAGFSLAVGLLWFGIASAPRARAMETEERQQARVPQRETIGMLLRDPTVLLLLAMSVGVFMFNHGLNNWLPELLRSDGMSATSAGYWAAIPTIIGIVGSLTIPRLATPGRRFTILLMLALAAVLATFLLHSHSRPVLLAGLMMQGIARSALMTVLMLALIELPTIGARHAGIAAGLFFAAAEVGGVLGPVSLGALYDLTGGFDAALHLLSVVTIGLVAGAIVLRRSARGARQAAG